MIFGCNNNDGNSVACTEIYVYGLNVTVKNAVSNEIITNGITVLASEGDYAEELVLFADSYSGAGERPGSYILKITGNEYQNYISEIIEVGTDVCHVIPELVQIDLQPN